MSAKRKFIETQVVPQVRPIMMRHIVDAVSTRAGAIGLTFDELMEKHLAPQVLEAALFVLRSNEIASLMKEVIRDEIETLARAEVAKRADELEQRVRAAVDESFEKSVSTLARQLLDVELEKIRGRFA